MNDPDPTATGTDADAPAPSATNVDDSGAACTVHELVSHLAPALWGPGDASPRLPAWPPDLFAVVASVLEKSGAYTRVVGHWPPPDWQDDLPPAEEDEDDPSWDGRLQAVGDAWRENWPGDPPAILQTWWETLVSQRRLPISQVADNRDLCFALLQLLAAADEACYDISAAFFDEEGVSNESGPDSFEGQARKLIIHYRESEGTTLCKSIHPSRVRVLPKARTPRSGMTLRSLSLYLALCPGCEVNIGWHVIAGWKAEAENYLNLLLVPRPGTVLPSHFRHLRRTVHPPTDPHHLLFEFNPSGGSSPSKTSDEEIKTLAQKIQALIREAKRTVGKIDGLVLPECAVDSEEYEAIWKPVSEENGLLIAGVRGRDPNGFALNYIETRIPVGPTPFIFQQSKHHRWKLDKSQIRNYGLASQLHPDSDWWEGIELGRRQLSFITFQPWLSLCTLICEDLARQEPMAAVIRSVAPSLVIALLMDGPQLKTRWPSRYATVLADDPGSSVLTLSSIGMVGLSRPFDGYLPSRAIALWRDPLSPNAVEIPLEAGSEGVVINLVNTYNLEQAADGRHDESNKTLILGGVHQVKPERDC